MKIEKSLFGFKGFVGRENISSFLFRKIKIDNDNFRRPINLAGIKIAMSIDK